MPWVFFDGCLGFLRCFPNIIIWFYCKTTFVRWILISRFSYVENLLHFSLADFFSLFYYAICFLLVIGNSRNLCVFNIAILLKSRKFDGREIDVFYTNCFSFASKPIAQTKPHYTANGQILCVCVHCFWRSGQHCRVCVTFLHST